MQSYIYSDLPQAQKEGIFNFSVRGIPPTAGVGGDDDGNCLLTPSQPCRLYQGETQFMSVITSHNLFTVPDILQSLFEEV